MLIKTACGLPFTGLAIAVALVLCGQPCAAQVPSVVPIVKEVYAHDPAAFTQGLLFWEGMLYESTGLRGRSTLRSVVVDTGQVQRSISLSDSEFGEGLARVEDQLIQLTWTSGTAHVYSINTFEALKSFAYTGEGWGLCYDEQRLVMSDGSSSLFFRDPQTFELQASVAVQRNGAPVSQLNELECVNGAVYANVWQTNQILKIDPNTGSVIATIVVDGLLTAEEAAQADVLNGIAFDPGTNRFYITGKLWPKLFEVELPAEAAPDYVAPPTVDAALPTTDPNAADSAYPDPMPAPPRATSGCRCAIVPQPDSGNGAVLMGALGALGVLFARRRIG